jgi:hypothetical protein
MNNFIRGLEPKRAMGIGIRTWDNIGPDDVLISKGAPVYSYDNKYYRFTRDGARCSHYIQGSIQITEITRTVYKKRTVMIMMSYSKIYSGSNPVMINRLYGPLDQFQKYFIIKQNEL